MFSLYKNYIEGRLRLEVEKKLLHYKTEQQRFHQRQLEWETKPYVGDFLSLERFESIRSSQVKWSYTNWLENKNKADAISDILTTLKNL
jgi:hypothetical protein